MEGLSNERSLLERLRATEETARQCQLRFDATLDNIVDGLITIDEQGIIQSYNKACRKIFGYAAEEAIGKNVKMLMPAEYAAHHDRYLQNYRKTGIAKIIGIGREVEGLRQGGIRFPMHLSVAEIKLDDGKKLFIGILRDISLQKKWEEERRLLSSLVRSSGVCIIGKSLDGVINVWNLGAERLFGFTAAEAIGQTVSLIVPADKQAEENNILARLQKGQSSEFLETVRVTKAGKRLDVSLTESLVFDAEGRIIGASKIIYDISGRLQAERNLLRYTEELRRSNQELDEFAYIISHDLKEPLRGLQRLAQFLQEDYRDRLDAEGRGRLIMISTIVLRLDRLLDSLLYYSRLGRTEMAIGETNLEEMVQNVVAVLAVTLQEKNTKVEIRQKLPVIVCDRVRVAEVFRTLIGNALKYSDTLGNIIEIGVVSDHPRALGQTAFYVRDHGIGIPEKYLGSIFKMFKRLHAKEAYGGGSGSGLAIAKRIINQHGGEIWAESKGMGQGASFFFTLPQAQATSVAR